MSDAFLLSISAVNLFLASRANEILGLDGAVKAYRLTAGGALDLVAFIEIAAVAITVTIAVAITIAIVVTIVNVFFKSTEILVDLLDIVVEVLNVLFNVGNRSCHILDKSEKLVYDLCFGLCAIK